MSHKTETIIQPSHQITLEQFWQLANDTRLETEYFTAQNLQYLQTAPIEALRQICLQYRYFVRDYPNNLSILVSKLPYGNLKSLMAQILAEELGSGQFQKTHLTLWDNFLKSIGIDLQVLEDSLHPNNFKLLAELKGCSQKSLLLQKGDRHIINQSLSRYHRIEHSPEKIETAFLEIFLSSYKKPPKNIVLDLDVTDDEVHGNQESAFFNKSYNSVYYAPLYIFCGHHLLGAKLRASNIDPAAGALEELQRIIPFIREKWKETNILVRADSAYARDEIMNYCEEQPLVYYVIAMGINSQLKLKSGDIIAKAKADYTDAPMFQTFDGQTITYKGTSTLFPAFIGEASYYEKGIAMCLTEKQEISL